MTFPYRLYRFETLHRKLPGFLYNIVEWCFPDLYYQNLPTFEILRRFYRNRHLPYRPYTINNLRRAKKSDMLFILGSNRSVNDISDSTWEKIGDFDSLGFNYWIYHRFVPTYFAMEYGRDKEVDEFHAKLFQSRKIDYKDTIFLVSSRSCRRGIHPRTLPQFFPYNPRIVYYVHPKILHCPKDRPFRKEDFKETIFYRGSLNLHLHFARLLRYKKIVLVGCEMDTGISFYDNLPEAQWMYEIEGYLVSYEKRLKMKYGGAYEHGSKHSMVNTILAINDFVFKPENIELYVFNKKSLIYPTIPLFEF